MEEKQKRKPRNAGAGPGLCEALSARGLATSGSNKQREQRLKKAQELQQLKEECRAAGFDEWGTASQLRKRLKKKRQVGRKAPSSAAQKRRTAVTEGDAPGNRKERRKKGNVVIEAEAEAEAKAKAEAEAKAKAEADAKAKAELEAKNVARSKAKAKAKAEAKAESSAEGQNEGQIEGTGESGTESKSEAKAEAKAESSTEGRIEGTADNEVEDTADAKPARKIERKASPKAGEAVESKEEVAELEECTAVDEKAEEERLAAEAMRSERELIALRSENVKLKRRLDRKLLREAHDLCNRVTHLAEVTGGGEKVPDEAAADVTAKAPRKRKRITEGRKKLSRMDGLLQDLTETHEAHIYSVQQQEASLQEVQQKLKDTSERLEALEAEQLAKKALEEEYHAGEDARCGIIAERHAALQELEEHRSSQAEGEGSAAKREDHIQTEPGRKLSLLQKALQTGKSDSGKHHTLMMEQQARQRYIKVKSLLRQSCIKCSCEQAIHSDTCTIRGPKHEVRQLGVDVGVTEDDLEFIRLRDIERATQQIAAPYSKLKLG